MNTPILEQWQRTALRRKEFAFIKTLEKKPEARVYLVGGFVRDLLLKRESKDIDFVVTGVPKTKLEELLKKHGRVNFVGRSFGVYKFSPKGTKGEDAFDIALPRIDLPKGKTGAYRDVRVVSRPDLAIEEDLKRRDYTVNALAWSLTEKKLVDLGQGLADLKAKRLRTVGKPDERFQEDYSRILRGLRFAAQLQFSFDPRTWRAMRSLVTHLNDTKKGQDVVPREVIAKELLKTFYANPSLALELYDTSGALDVLIPEAKRMKKCPQPKPYHMEGDVWQHTKLALKRLSEPMYRRHFPERPDAELILAVFLHDIAKPYTLKTPKKDGVDRVRFDGHDFEGGKLAKAIAERLKLSSMPAGPLHVRAEHLEWLVAHHLLLLHDAARQMKLTTIERYFITHPLAQKLQQLILADSLATIPKSGRPYMKHLRILWAILKKIQQHGTKPPPALLNGDEIMRILKIESGPNVGLVSRRLREAQLTKAVKTKRQAVTYIKKEYASI